MITETSQSSQDDVYMYTPPALPAHLATIYDLKPITGQPTNEQVITIHAAMRAVNAEAQVPHLCNPELSLQLSQHLFSVQMAVYRNAYPLSILPRDNTYAPPSLPTHIPITLETVTGSPSNEQLKTAQDAMRIVESRGYGPLFDPDLNMHLSQHLFNLQLARYIQDSTLGQFTSRPNESRHIPLNNPGSDEGSGAGSMAGSNAGSGGSSDAGSMAGSLEMLPPDTIDTRPEAHITQPELARSAVPVPNITRPLGPEPVSARNHTSPEITQLAQAMDTIKELMSESKGVLENINRVLIATQRNQAVTGVYNTNTYVHRNPVNDRGVTAVESGLPQLRYYYCGRNYHISVLNPAQLAGYLRFFDIGADLIEGTENDVPRLKDGVQIQAGNLILKHLGLVY
ncbi:hypothetical protein RSOL_009020 [Rhizoctonia solani AG-3 Rhs1AP]|uniref:Laminin domain protein n=1 Tax=Rhizoctonia solani AG-3 Rhs1AP TaxID=1086054 RepID=X8IUW7_9AGAM|nr:hypothetical protein RSOL_009020 [Rhizoctonia solani AG-3 Rhs1AP]